MNKRTTTLIAFLLALGLSNCPKNVPKTREIRTLEGKIVSKETGTFTAGNGSIKFNYDILRIESNGETRRIIYPGISMDGIDDTVKIEYAVCNNLSHHDFVAGFDKTKPILIPGDIVPGVIKADGIQTDWEYAIHVEF